MKVQAGKVCAHLQDQHRHREDRPDPEPSRHVGQFGARTAIFRDPGGFQRHAADRAIARLRPSDLRVHRTRIDSALSRWGARSCYGRPHILGRIGDELGPTAGATKVVSDAVALRTILRCRHIHGHSANRIARLARPQRCGRGDSNAMMVFVMFGDRHAARHAAPFLANKLPSKVLNMSVNSNRYFSARRVNVFGVSEQQSRSAFVGCIGASGNLSDKSTSH